MRWGELPAKQRKIILIVWPLVVVAVFGYMSYGALGTLGDDPKLQSVSFIPRAKAKKNLWSQIKGLEQQIQAEKAVVSRKAMAEEELADAKLRMAELQSRLPNQKQKEEMRLRLQEMVNDVPRDVGEVRFVGVSIQEAADAGAGRRRGGKSDHSTVTYRLELNADMNGLIWYLDRVEKNPRFMSVNALTVTPGSIEVDRDNLEITTKLHKVDLDVVTYVLHDKEG
ncbi:MAG: hypothetical protein PF961_13815 [Planctomycetota bacterium]|jgi:hypothetical protein|nr:hypothetical protein [Planctomycetota bacterium]